MSPFLVLPPIFGAEYIIDLWHDLGVVESNSNGISRVSWQEFESWIKVRKHNLNDWEISTLRKISEEYVAEYQQASEKTRPAPYAYDDIDRKEVAKKIGNVLAGFKIKKEPNYEVDE